eukprot:comp17527_c0_seq1/m.17075 comp17527_c0_seq1/g.17075  ORF comp17527_c0_seq1/g.17075 comp17527_c0_seq1/m.17075 type:complete len:139 (-) comp17527_c0_seq1:871-1287(-)
MYSLSDIQKIGLGLTGFGLFFLVFGSLAVFDRGLLALGNILLVAGLATVNGMQKTVIKFFGSTQRLPGAVLFLGGAVLVGLGYAAVGLVVEVVGLVHLFWEAIPLTISYVRRLPVLGALLSYPPLAQVLDMCVPQHAF